MNWNSQLVNVYWNDLLQKKRYFTFIIIICVNTAFLTKESVLRDRALVCMYNIRSTRFPITLISVDPHRRYFPVLVDRDEEGIRKQMRTIQMLMTEYNLAAIWLIFFFCRELWLISRKEQVLSTNWIFNTTQIKIKNTIWLQKVFLSWNICHPFSPFNPPPHPTATSGPNHLLISLPPLLSVLPGSWQALKYLSEGKECANIVKWRRPSLEWKWGP